MEIQCIFDVGLCHGLGFIDIFNVLWLNQYTYIYNDIRQKSPHRTLLLSRSSFFLAAVLLVRPSTAPFRLVCVFHNVIVLLVICDM